MMAQSVEGGGKTPKEKTHKIELTPMERHGLLQVIGYVINKRVNDKASDLSYTELLNLKNKLFEE